MAGLEGWKGEVVDMRWEPEVEDVVGPSGAEREGVGREDEGFEGGDAGVGGGRGEGVSERGT